MTWPDLATRRRQSDERYRADPMRFSGPPSEFAEWSRALLSGRFRRPQVLELGCGTGRDARRLADTGAIVRAVDHAPLAIARARAAEDPPAGLRYETNDALSAAREVLSDSLDAVYARVLYMLIPPPEMQALLGEVRRIVHPGGLHVYAVRATSDPRASESTQVAPGVWQGGAHPSPFRYFDEASLGSLRAPGFERVTMEYRRDSYLWYVADIRVD